MARQLFGKTPSLGAAGRNVIVVSGLPRSGTSMMMKMLAEGGIPILTDSIRQADEDNPNGYYEFEPIKQLTEGRSEWLSGAGQKAIKVISALLEHLPPEYHYKVIFMERDLQEVLASQRKMLTRRNQVSPIRDAELEVQFQNHLKAVKYWLARQPNMEVLYVSYNELISNPEPACRTLVQFLSLPLDVAKLSSVPNESLYRNRGLPH